MDEYRAYAKEVGLWFEALADAEVKASEGRLPADLGRGGEPAGREATSEGELSWFCRLRECGLEVAELGLQTCTVGVSIADIHGTTFPARRGTAADLRRVVGRAETPAMSRWPCAFACGESELGLHATTAMMMS